ncbi:2-dehydropantoate 2-reductase [Bacillus timonensis]|uniref:2-dehydropantoate 2-reductase n=1 Tax=Bacillus timonensis TaxID=1033734 RepID=UPI000289E01A|nr:2-dehydropantoate 2-reductase [Bacillus timonensis]
MKIGIIGGGSIGLLFAGYLSENNDVTVYTRTTHQADEINKIGVTINKQNFSKTFRVQAVTSSSSVLDKDLVFIAVKQYTLNDVLSNVQDLEKVQTICFLQNGMSHINMMKQLENPNILVGVVEHGAFKINETTVIHTGIGRTKIGVFKGKNYGLDKEIYNFPIEFHKNWYEIISSKLIANAVINPLTALYGVRNGELLHNEYFHNQMNAVFNDIISVIPSNKNEMWELVTTICKNTAENKSSMLRDIEEGRKTEVDAILGYLLVEAEKLKQEVAVIQFLFDSIKGLEIKGG